MRGRVSGHRHRLYLRGQKISAFFPFHCTQNTSLTSLAWLAGDCQCVGGSVGIGAACVLVINGKFPFPICLLLNYSLC